MNGSTLDTYKQQGFGASLMLQGPFALVIVDFIHAFADPGQFGGGNIAKAIANTVSVLDDARRLGWPVAHARIVFADDGSDANLFSAKVPGLLRLTENAKASAIVDELSPRRGELVVRKNLPSAFAGTTLASWLVGRSVRTVALAGCVTSGCIRATAVDAMNLGFMPVLIEECVGDRALGPHRASLFDLQQKYAEVMAWPVVKQLCGSHALQGQGYVE